MNDQDFTIAPPSRRIVAPELAALTDEERRQVALRSLWGDVEWKPRPSQWQPGAPSDPAVLRLLDFAHAPNGQPLPPGRFREPIPPGPSASEQEIGAYAALRHRLAEQHKADDESHMVRFHYWIGLDPALKTQLAAD